ncbi:SGNH/GDSL hydrolase family protein [Streptomyces sp. NPDC059853]|uniref:SGNH/GDSL hydrolase family protein n=1 Tax=Streptomyces sp. NPDC059853 TaxID=3346973 RepID=UPI00364C734B
MTDCAIRALPPAGLLLAPVLAWQGTRIRRDTPRLPEADGLDGTEGTGDGPPLRLLVLGDSLAAGCGVDHNSEGLAGVIARALAQQHGRPVAWQVLARRGATIASALDTLVPRIRTVPDVVVISLGINELTRFRSLRRWRALVRRFLSELRCRVGDEPVVVFCGLPPVGRFPALPQPLRGVLALRARLMDRDLRAVAARFAVGHAPLSAPGIAEGPGDFFARDGFHPSAAGYRETVAAFTLFPGVPPPGRVPPSPVADDQAPLPETTVPPDTKEAGRNAP